MQYLAGSSSSVKVKKKKKRKKDGESKFELLLSATAERRGKVASSVVEENREKEKKEKRESKRRRRKEESLLKQSVVPWKSELEERVLSIEREIRGRLWNCGNRKKEEKEREDYWSVGRVWGFVELVSEWMKDGRRERRRDAISAISAG